jgi:hypothetical protein
LKDVMFFVGIDSDSSLLLSGGILVLENQFLDEVALSVLGRNKLRVGG